MSHSPIVKDVISFKKSLELARKEDLHHSSKCLCDFLEASSDNDRRGPMPIESRKN